MDYWQIVNGQVAWGADLIMLALIALVVTLYRPRGSHENQCEGRVTLQDFWIAKTDDEIAAAAIRLSEYTADAQRIILAEVSRRGLSVPKPAEAQEAEAGTAGVPPFFPISCLKFAVLSIFTFGFYNFYWFYKQWQKVNEREQSLWPTARAFLSIAFCYPLCERVEELSEKLRIPSSIVPGRVALLYGTLAMLPRLEKLHPLLSLMTFVTFLPLLEAQRQVNRINAAVAPGVDTNSRFSLWNVAATLPGALLVALSLIQPLLAPSNSAQQPAGPSPTEIKLSKLVHLSALVAVEDRSTPVPDLKTVTQRVADRTEQVRTYAASRITRNFTKESPSLGDHIVAEWRLDHVRPDQYHVRQAVSNGDFDEWITIAGDHFQNVGLWMKIDAGTWRNITRSLLFDDAVTLLRQRDPDNATVFRYEAKSYLRLEYSSPPPDETTTTPPFELVALECASLKEMICKTHIWIDLESNLIAKTDFIAQGKNAEGQREDFDFQQAFAAYNEPIVVRRPKLNAKPDANGMQVITDGEVEVVPFYP